MPEALPSTERRTGEDRRAGLRRTEDRVRFVRTVGSALAAICGGLVVLFVFLAAIDAFKPGQAAAASGAAIGLALIWFVFFVYRMRTGVTRLAQRSDRERRGF